MNLSINEFEIQTYPFKYGVGHVDLPFTYDELISAINNESESNKLIRSNDNYQKTEIRSSSTDGIIRNVLQFMSSTELSYVLGNLFDVETLSPDQTYDGGGLTITDVGGHLHYHADFPFSNQAKKYRVVNCLLYLSSPDLVGGELHLIDPTTKTVEGIVYPTWGRILAFPTTRHTPHGFSIIRSGKRIGVNAYFYAEKPLDDRYAPSKTEWL